MSIPLEESQAGGRYEFTHESGASIHFDRVDPQRTRIYSFVQLFEKDATEPIGYGTIDLTSTGQRHGLIKDLSDSSLPWRDIVHTTARRVIEDQFTGEPPVRLADVEPTDSTPWLLDPLVEGSGATLLAAAGGSAKSYLCLAAAVSVATGKTVIEGFTPSTTSPVLYLDWEADAHTHNHRLRRICNGAGIDVDIDVHYRREKSPLSQTIPQIGQICDDYDIGFLVIDSVMLARGGDAFGPQDTAALFAALRELGRPALLADHKSRDALSKAKRGAYGSIVGENSARRVWEVNGSIDKPGRKEIGLENTKANNAEKHEPIGLAFTWSDGTSPAVTIGMTDVKGLASATVEKGARHWQSIQAILEASEPLTVAELQDRLHESGITIKDNTLRSTLGRYPDKFKNVGSSNKGVWTTTSRNPELFGRQATNKDEPPPPEEPPVDAYESIDDAEVIF